MPNNMAPITAFNTTPNKLISPDSFNNFGNTENNVLLNTGSEIRTQITNTMTGYFNKFKILVCKGTELSFNDNEFKILFVLSRLLLIVLLKSI